MARKIWIKINNLIRKNHQKVHLKVIIKDHQFMNKYKGQTGTIMHKNLIKDKK